jgi:hypothetical protein
MPEPLGLKRCRRCAVAPISRSGYPSGELSALSGELSVTTHVMTDKTDQLTTDYSKLGSPLRLPRGQKRSVLEVMMLDLLALSEEYRVLGDVRSKVSDPLEIPAHQE